MDKKYNVKEILTDVFILDSALADLLIEKLETVKTDLGLKLIYNAIENEIQENARSYIFNFLKIAYKNLK